MLRTSLVFGWHVRVRVLQFTPFLSPPLLSFGPHGCVVGSYDIVHDNKMIMRVFLQHSSAPQWMAERAVNYCILVVEVEEQQLPQRERLIKSYANYAIAR